MSIKFKITYSSIESVFFNSEKQLKQYLSQEKLVWGPFLEMVKTNGTFRNFVADPNRTLSGEVIASSLESLINAPMEIEAFNSLTEWQYSKNVPPPPSASIDGRLILGLFGKGFIKEASEVFLSFLASEYTPVRRTQQVSESIISGSAMRKAAVVSSVLPFHDAKMSEIRALEKSLSQALSLANEEEQRIREKSDDYIKGVERKRKLFFRRIRSISSILVKKEKVRTASFDNWIAEKNAIIAERFEEAESRLLAIERLNAKQYKQRQDRHDELVALFFEELKFKAPVKLWRDRAEIHETNAFWSRIVFYSFCVVAMCFAVLVPFVYGSDIASSFSTKTCIDNAGKLCLERFSAKGPLILGGLLLISSIVVWLIRLQHKIYLSERHLSLDAKEKEAFAETYLALRHDSSVDVTNQAIVLQALFRPTQDGIVKDDEPSIDLSIASMLAKQFSK